MSISFDSADAKINRSANIPNYTAFTIAGWWYFDSYPGSGDRGVYMLRSGSGTEVALLRYRQSVGGFRFGHANEGTNFGSSPTTGQWAYMYLRSNGTNLQAGYKLIADSNFSGKQWSQSVQATTPNNFDVGANPFDTTAIDGNVFRLSVWDEYVSDANLLLAAATDLGYTTNINTHIAGTATGDPARYADSSGNSRNWTPTGTISDGSNPTFSSFIPRRMMLGVG
jgi:hypothetical protein